MQRIVGRTYADPVRYAKRIAIFEQCGMTQEEASKMAPARRQPVAGADEK